MFQNVVRILVAEDSDEVFDKLEKALVLQGYDVKRVEGPIGTYVDLSDADLLILDYDFSGLASMPTLKFVSSQCQIPIVIIDDVHDRAKSIKSLEAGADDYFSKPIDIKELVARVGALLRRVTHAANMIDFSAVFGHQGPCKNIVCFDKWMVNPEKYEITSKRGEPCSLTTGDFALLLLLLKNAHTVLSRDTITNALHGHEWSPYDRSIDNHISRLRRKIEDDPNNPKIIKTVRGAGYILVADVKKFSVPERQLAHLERLVG